MRNPDIFIWCISLRATLRDGNGLLSSTLIEYVGDPCQRFIVLKSNESAMMKQKSVLIDRVNVSLFFVS